MALIKEYYPVYETVNTPLCICLLCTKRPFGEEYQKSPALRNRGGSISSKPAFRPQRFSTYTAPDGRSQHA
jgi:hypothetical protein